MIPVQADIEQGECIRRDPAPYEPITYHVPLDADLQQYTAEMCDLYEVPLELAYAVMQVESGYTVSATSSTGDYGLMQINSINAGWLKDELGVTDLLDAGQNIKAGCYMLGSYLALYDGDINRTMMAYNLGKSGAERAWNAGTRSTAYTDKVWSAMVGLLEEERKRLRKTICSFPWMGGSDDFRIQRIQAGADCYARRWQLSVPAGRSEQDRKGKMRQYGLPLLSGSAGLP